MKLFVSGNPLSIDVKKSLGKGMEADVYRVGDRAVKVFKSPSHPDLQGMDAVTTARNVEAARKKIEEHQQKLKMFPKSLPPRVVVPIDLVQDSSGMVVGYTMRLVDNPRQARVFGEVAERMNGIDPNQIVSFMTDLHGTVGGLHSRRVVLGDFNDLNILVSGNEAHVIDADSFQFGQFPCRMYTAEFVDPRLCDPNAHSPVLRGYHDDDSDWYAYSAMLFKLLLCVGPFGGMYKPSKRKDIVLQDQRPLKGISVFNPEVTYPKKAVHFRMLPDDVLDYFQKVFEKGVRGEFPKNLIAGVRWTTCPSCGVSHARKCCPDCQVALPPAAVKETVEVKGKIKSTMVFKTPGRILHASMQDGMLKWLYAEDGKFIREDRSVVCNGKPDHGMRYRIHNSDTIIGKGSSVIVIRKDTEPAQLAVDQFRGNLMFEASSAGVFWQHGGSIVRGNKLGLDYDPQTIGQVLEGQTVFWVGDEFGLGFYRAGEISVAFVFDATGRNLNDSVQLPRVPGQLVGAKCVFGGGWAALTYSFKDGPKITNRCVMVKSTGEVVGMAEADEGDGSWLSSISGKCVVGNSVLAATDDGLVKVDFVGGVASKETRFEGSDAFVDSASHLFASKGGLYCVGDGKVSLLQLC